MQEVEGVVNGTYDYMQLKGDTGPLVCVIFSFILFFFYIKLPLIFILKNFLLVLNFIHLILRLLLGTEMCSGHKT